MRECEAEKERLSALRLCFSVEFVCWLRALKKRLLASSFVTAGKCWSLGRQIPDNGATLYRGRILLGSVWHHWAWDSRDFWLLLVVVVGIVEGLYAACYDVHYDWKNCWVLVVDFALLLLTSGVLHSHAGIAWGRVEWCGFEAKLRMKWRENDAKIRYFAEIWLRFGNQMFVGIGKMCWKAKLLLLYNGCVGERVYETVVDWRECYCLRVICREWRY